MRADPAALVGEDALRRMARALRHRGPDGFGLAREPGAGLVSTRLAIVDIEHGWQPMTSGPRGSVLVYNGEVYNHPELRADLARDGIHCVTRTDTEVVLRLLERDGLAALHQLNGQFAFGWWEPERRRLTLVRDRFGVRPLQWASTGDGGVVFASEAKALFASGEIDAALDLQGIDEVFTWWGAQPPRTAFRDVHQLAPGSLLVWEKGRVSIERWWTPGRAGHADAWDAESENELEALIEDSVRLRLRADVAVGAYLSGGLDSSLLSALACEAVEHPLQTFSVAFDDPAFDERTDQEEVAAALGTQHHVVVAHARAIADTLPAVVRHAESPLVRTAPVPLFLLAQHAREHGIAVVATGEGADELFWGYDLFKETQLRLDALRDPAAAERFDDLYDYMPGDRTRGSAWRRFFMDAGDPEDPLFSHQPRVRATSAIKSLYRPEISASLPPARPLERVRATLPVDFADWSPMERASHLEVRTLLDPYLLGAQGDRMAMAHGVEGRFPFLDHRIFASAAALPPNRKLQGMREKIALREIAARRLPARVAQRPKRPYRAPGITPFVGEQAPAWVAEMLSANAVDAVGIFDAARVGALLRQASTDRGRSDRLAMALIAVLSTQLFHAEFCSPSRYGQEPGKPRVLLERNPRMSTEV